MSKEIQFQKGLKHQLCLGFKEAERIWMFNCLAIYRSDLVVVNLLQFSEPYKFTAENPIKENTSLLTRGLLYLVTFTDLSETVEIKGLKSSSQTPTRTGAASTVNR